MCVTGEVVSFILGVISDISSDTSGKINHKTNTNL